MIDLSDIRRIVYELPPPPDPEDYEPGTMARGLAVAATAGEPFYVTRAELSALHRLSAERQLEQIPPGSGSTVNAQWGAVDVVVDPPRALEQRTWRPITTRATFGRGPGSADGVALRCDQATRATFGG